jgi:hypothetical protein
MASWVSGSGWSSKESKKRTRRKQLSLFNHLVLDQAHL